MSSNGVYNDKRKIDEAWHIRQIHDANPIPASFWDASFRVTDCNDALVRLLEISSKE
ncbi:MAG: PAS domain-containing protein [Defluviitaleaceae bacterium]|nr:PAS domain-containing protein [Defluviitaleaceae bacterium]